MRSKVKRILPIAVLAAVALALTACNRTAARTDAEIGGEVQGKFYADQAVSNKSIQVKTANGVVTLSGTVTSDGERAAAAADAASVAGVRTVVNNLDVIPPLPQSAANEASAPAAPSEASAPQAAPPPPEPQAPERSTRNRRDRYSKPSAASRRDSRQPQPRNYSQSTPPDQPSYAQQSYAAAGQQAYAPGQSGYEQQQAAQQPYAPPQQPTAAPAAPQAPARVTVPNGTSLSIRLLDPLDSESAQVGDTFRASLSHPVELDGNIVIPADADVMGRVVDVQSAGKFKGAALLTLELTKLSYNGSSYRIRTNEWSKQIQGRGKNTAEKVGGGAVLGAIIGGLAGGGKGAAIGTLAGAGAGGTAQAVTHAKQITLEPETRLSFQLQQPVSVHPASMNERNAGRPRLE